MGTTNINKLKYYLTLLALGMAGGSIFIIPYIKFVFYDAQLAATGMTNAQSGFLMTAYAIGILVCSIPGGMIADRINSKKGVVLALLLVTAATVLYAFTMTSFIMALAIWFIFAFLTMGVYWPTFAKILDIVGMKTGVGGRSGSAFGIYYCFNGICAAIIQAVSIWASTRFNDPATSFKVVVMIAALSTLLAAIMVYFLLDKELISMDKEIAEKLNAAKEEGKMDKSQLGAVFKTPIVWVLVLMSTVFYVMYTTSSYFTPFLTAVVGVSPESSGIFAILRTYVFLLLSPIGGYFADKVFKSSAKWFMIVYIILIIVVGGLFLIPEGANSMLVSIYTLIPAAFVMMSYTIKYSAISEIDIPKNMVGTAVGLTVFAGGIPELFVGPLIGYLLDTRGNAAYYYMFGFLVVALLLGCICSTIIYRSYKKRTSVQ